MKNRKSIMGIDIGSIAIAIAQLDTEKNIIKTSYSFHEGNIHGTLSNLLKEYDLNQIRAISRTTSSPDILKNSNSYDSRVSFIKATQLLNRNQKIDSILIVGGEKFGWITFDKDGEYLNYKSNTSCAAGTGSFLDQQAKRLNLDNIAEFSQIALSNNGNIPKIASRCAVFAKTDLIHAQQEGYSLSEICDGLSFGLSKNICDTLFVEDRPDDNIIFIGGVYFR
jgi:activator of 2-hydroxyglutaryl-CoA dehydratase